MRLAATWMAACVALSTAPLAAQDFSVPFTITVTAEESGLPVPAVQLETVNGIRLYTDVDGQVHFFEPGWEGESIFFRVAKTGWQAPLDGFGYPSARFVTTSGGSGAITIRRISPDVGSEPVGAYPSFVPTPADYFAIRVVDSETGRGVPIVRVESPGGSYYTDSGGYVAFYDPSRMGSTVTFDVTAHGYAFTGPGGDSTVNLVASSGSTAVLEVDRHNVAERLYRISGAGSYCDTHMLGLPAPIRAPLSNADVVGQNSTASTVHRGKIYWFSGDARYSHYPLGNFFGTGAVSQLPSSGGLSPADGVNLSYLLGPSGHAKAVAPFGSPGNPTWVHTPMTAWSGSAEELFILYTTGGFDPIEHGIAVFNDDEEVFEKAWVSDGSALPRTGHPLNLRVRGTEYIYFTNRVRVRRTRRTILDPSTWQVYTPIDGRGNVRYGRHGHPAYAWTTSGEIVTPEHVRDGVLAAEHVPFDHLADPDTGDTVREHMAAIAWNAYRQRFIKIATQRWGASPLGEAWYAEADTPMGPWVYARKIVSHASPPTYSFYHVNLHPYFDDRGGRIIYFDGTYAAWMSGSSSEPTPRHDYNIVMYRLDLDDDALNLPVAVYNRSRPARPARRLFFKREMSAPSSARYRPWFFAKTRPAPGTVPVQATRDGRGRVTLTVGGDDATAYFHALPVDHPAPPQTVVPLYEHRKRSNDARRAYTTNPEARYRGWSRSPDPICLVWRNPIAIKFRPRRYLGRDDGTCCR